MLFNIQKQAIKKQEKIKMKLFVLSKYIFHNLRFFNMYSIMSSIQIKLSERSQHRQYLSLTHLNAN